MTLKMEPLPARTMNRIQRFTVLVVGLSVIASVVITNVILEVFSGGLNGPGMAATILTPLVLGGPTTFFLILRREQIRHAYGRLEILATTDTLTGCLNRSAFTQRAEADLLSGRSCAGMLVIDADRFKAVNDTFGHQAGDRALTLIAQALRQAAGPQALVGRLGGEEFGVYCPVATTTDILAFADALAASVGAVAFAADGQDWPLSVSVGWAVAPRPCAFDALYKSADDSLYRAKARTHRNDVLRPAA